MVGYRNAHAWNLAKLAEHLDHAIICHMRAMQLGNYRTQDPKWYSNARKEHMRQARYYRDQLTATKK
jgi:hypothetical protein